MLNNGYSLSAEHTKITAQLKAKVRHQYKESRVVHIACQHHWLRLGKNCLAQYRPPRHTEWSPSHKAAQQVSKFCTFHCWTREKLPANDDVKTCDWNTNKQFREERSFTSRQKNLKLHCIYTLLFSLHTTVQSTQPLVSTVPIFNNQNMTQCSIQCAKSRYNTSQNFLWPRNQA